MQKNIAFYISDHDLQHGLRNIPLLQNILKMENEGRLFVKSGKEQIKQMKELLSPNPNLQFCEMEMRDQDMEAWDELAEREMIFLKKEQIGLIVSDICPWIFIAADELRIKSILIGNYTWSDFSEDIEEKEAYASCYELANRMFLYDFHKPEMTGYGVEYDLISMMNFPYHMEKVESLEEKLGGSFIFADMPGIGPVDVSSYPYRFVVTEGTDLRGDNVVVYEEGPGEIHNYVAASIYTIAYASWTRVGQVVLSNKKAAFLVKNKDDINRYVLDVLKQRGQCVEIEEEEWENPGEVLEKLEKFSYSYEHEYYNSDYDLARYILYAYPEKRRRNRS